MLHKNKGGSKIEREFHTVRGYQMLNSENRILTSSMEDYLEMVYRVCSVEGYVRMNHLAEKLNVRPSSTTKVIKKLKELGLVEYQKYGIVQLTKEGEEMGAFLLKRHRIIEDFLRSLGIKETLKDTEMVEHDISFNSLKSIHIFNEFLKQNTDIVERFYEYKKDFIEV